MPRNLIDITDLSVEEIDQLIATAEDIIANPVKYQSVCAHKQLATLFFEPSTRTRPPSAAKPAAQPNRRSKITSSMLPGPSAQSSTAASSGAASVASAGYAPVNTRPGPYSRPNRVITAASLRRTTPHPICSRISSTGA